MKVRISIFLFLIIIFITLVSSINSAKKENTTSPEKESEEEEKDSDSEKSFSSVDDPIFSLQSGFYDSEDIKKLQIESNDTIYYTLDSTDPTTSETAQIYSKPIKMFDRSTNPNIYSKYQHEDNSPYSITGSRFKAGTKPFDKITIVRAVAQNDKGEFSNIVTKSYFVMDSEKLDYYKGIPVVSLVTNPENLFDKEKGIYVVGQKYVDYLKDPDNDKKKAGNYMNYNQKGKDWEREAVFTFFKEGGEYGFTQNLGIRIKGSSTTNHKNKSFNIYARKKYGKGKLDFELLENNKCFVDNTIIGQYDSFSLRSIEWVERMRERIVQSGFTHIGSIATYDTERCMVFINGELWGLYDIMERCSAYWIASNYKIKEDDVAIIKNGVVEAGPDSEYDDLKELNEFCKNNSLFDELNYQYVISQIDVDSIILHYATGFYIGIWDWPNHNYLMWRNMGNKNEDNKFSDGKWRFGIFDFDFSVGLTYGNYGGVEGYAFDNFQKFINEKKGEDFPSSIFVALLQHPVFRQRFIDIFDSFYENVFEPNKMEELIDQINDKYTKYHAMSGWRWRSNDTDSSCESFINWDTGNLGKELNKMKTFFNNRANFTFDHLENFLNKTVDINNAKDIYNEE